MHLNRIFIRFAALVSVISITTGITKWPDIMFISSCIMIIIWAHAEWDYYSQKKKN